MPQTRLKVRTKLNGGTVPPLEKQKVGRVSSGPSATVGHQSAKPKHLLGKKKTIILLGFGATPTRATWDLEKFQNWGGSLHGAN